MYLFILHYHGILQLALYIVELGNNLMTRQDECTTERQYTGRMHSIVVSDQVSNRVATPV